MTKKRKAWFITWAIIIGIAVLAGVCLTGVYGILTFAIFPLILFGFIELIRLFIVSVKRGKEKYKIQKEKIDEQIKREKEQREQMEQNAVIEEANSSLELPAGNYSKTEEPLVDKKVNPIKGLIISVIYLFLFPLRMLNIFFVATVNMDSAAWFGRLFGIKVIKCRYCDRYFSSFHGLRYSCEHSPTGKHRE